MSDPKRFEDLEEVDCNECAHYWQDSCDGASKGSRVGCNSFLASRNVVIPEKINWLEKRVKQLEWEVTILGVCISIVTLGILYMLVWC